MTPLARRWAWTTAALTATALAFGEWLVIVPTGALLALGAVLERAGVPLW